MMPSQFTTSFGPEDWAIGHRAIRERFALEQDEADAKCKLANEVLRSPYPLNAYLMRIEGLPYAEIAVRLGKTPNALRLAVARAQRIITAHVQQGADAP